MILGAITPEFLNLHSARACRMKKNKECFLDEAKQCISIAYPRFEPKFGLGNRKLGQPVETALYIRTVLAFFA
jgi:hypothetical protein